MSLEVLIASVVLDKHMEGASDEIRKAWRIIRNQLNPKRIKRRKV
jgi:hypothetical protein